MYKNVFLRFALLLSFLLVIITCSLVGVEDSAKGHVKQVSSFDFGVDGFCMQCAHFFLQEQILFYKYYKGAVSNQISQNIHKSPKMCMYGTMDHWIMMYHVSHVIVTCFSFIFNIYYILYIYIYIVPSTYRSTLFQKVLYPYPYPSPSPYPCFLATLITENIFHCWS